MCVVEVWPSAVFQARLAIAVYNRAAKHLVIHRGLLLVRSVGHTKKALKLFPQQSMAFIRGVLLLFTRFWLVTAFSGEAMIVPRIIAIYSITTVHHSSLCFNTRASLCSMD